MVIDQPPDCSRVVQETQQAFRDASRDGNRKLAELMGQRLECERLSQAGWSPIDDAAKAGANVRRVSFEEGRLAFRIPAIAVEHRGRADVELRLSIDHPRRVHRVSVSEGVWRELIAEDEVTRPVRPRPRPVELMPSISSCHGWFVTLEVAHRRKSWTRKAQVHWSG